MFASYVAADWSALLRALLGGLVLFAGYFLLAVLIPGGMGFGDVKLAGVLGLMLGWLGWGSVITGTVLAFIYGGIGSLGLLAIRRASRTTRVAFGPFMLAGALTILMLGADGTSSWFNDAARIAFG